VPIVLSTPVVAVSTITRAWLLGVKRAADCECVASASASACDDDDDADDDADDAHRVARRAADDAATRATATYGARAIIDIERQSMTTLRAAPHASCAAADDAADDARRRRRVTSRVRAAATRAMSFALAKTRGGGWRCEDLNLNQAVATPTTAPARALAYADAARAMNDGGEECARAFARALARVGGASATVRAASVGEDVVEFETARRFAGDGDDACDDACARVPETVFGLHSPRDDDGAGARATCGVANDASLPTEDDFEFARSRADADVIGAVGVDRVVGEATFASTACAAMSPGVSAHGEAVAPSPGVSVGGGFANPFAHTPAFPQTQCTRTPASAPLRRPKFGFQYLRDASNDDEATPQSRKWAPGTDPKAPPAQSPYAIMQRHLASAAAPSTPYVNLNTPTPSKMVFTTAGGRNVVAGAERERGAADDAYDGQPRFDEDDDAAVFTFRAETPMVKSASVSAAGGGGGGGGGGMFMTGSGKPVTVSEDALRRAREKFGDAGDDSRFQQQPGARDDDVITPRMVPSTSGGFTGTANGFGAGSGAGASIFQTAGGKAVHVSEERLRESRAFFDSKENDGGMTTNTPIGKTIPNTPFPQPSFKTPSSLPAIRKPQQKTPGFTPPMRKTGAFTPPMSKLGGKIAASAPRQGAKRGRSSAGAIEAVHDLFQSRARMGMRAPLCTFFNGLAPFQQKPIFTDACVKTLSADTAKSLLLTSAERGLVGWRELRESMLKAGAREGLCTPTWVANAYKWVVWTHACIARAFPEKLAFGVLSESAVLRRLLYRYEREINRAERPHLRKVMEKDDNSGAPAVLVVSAIRSMTTASSSGDAPKMSEIEVSDGWYSMRARLDAKLTTYVRDGRLAVGHKIFIVGAELRGVTDAVAPLSEESEMAYLMLNVNGTRIAPWDATLGRVSYNLTVPLRTVVPDGGAVPRMIVHVRHVYPLMYQERRADGTSVMRCELAERRAQNKWHGARESVMHNMQEAMQNDGDGWSGGADPEGAMRDALEEKDLFERRTSVVLRMNVTGYNPLPGHPSYRGPQSLRGGASSAMLTVWDADAALIDAVRSGQTYAITALRPKATSQGTTREISLSTTRFTRWVPLDDANVRAGCLEHSEPMWRCVSVDAGVDLRDLSRSGLPRKEFDAIVCPVFKGPVRVVEGGRQSQWIFCLDASARVSGGSPDDAHLLAVEVSGRADDTFIDADDWTAASTSFFGDSSDSCGAVVMLSNLVYMNYDAENNVYAAKVMMEDVVATSLANARGGSLAHDAARALEAWRNDSIKSRTVIAALKKRARLLTGSEDVDVDASWDVNASQQQASQYDPPRLSADGFDDWNDEELVGEEFANVMDVTAKSAAPSSAMNEQEPPRSRRRSSRSSRG